MKMEYLSLQYQKEVLVLELRIKELKLRQKNEIDHAARRELSARIWKLMPMLIENRAAYRQCRRYVKHEKTAFADRN